MRTIINKLFFGTIFVFILWKGFDGLIINFLYNSETTVDILQLENGNEFDSRNLEILNGISGEEFVYYESDYSPPSHCKLFKGNVLWLWLEI